MPVSRDLEGALCFGGVPLPRLVCDKRAATPCYVYDLDAIGAATRAVREAFTSIPSLVAYAVKANSAGPILRAVGAAGGGADVVSRGELELALACGIPADRIVFSGVAKRDEEIALALTAGTTGIRGIHIESLEEILRIEAIASERGCVAKVALRVNPGGAKERLGTHAHIATGHDDAKFGVGAGDVEVALSMIGASPHLELVGLSTHIGSQLRTTAAYAEAATSLFRIASSVRQAPLGKKLRYLDTGGGFGIDYDGRGTPPPADFIRELSPAWHAHDLDGLAWVVEPGRSIPGPHGILVATVIQTKRASDFDWLFIDAGMNDLIRPALYGAHHRIEPLTVPADPVFRDFRVAGPVCESSDDFGAHRLPSPPSSHVAILDAGAYGASMASHYNGRTGLTQLFLSRGRIDTVIAGRPVEEWVARNAAT